MNGLIGDSEVHGHLSRGIVLADAGVEAEQDDRELAVKRSRVINSGIAGVGDGIDICLQDATGLIVE